MSSVKTVAVIGSGVMGRGIAQAIVAGGLSVVLLDNSPAALESARAQFAVEYAKLVEKGQLDGSGRVLREKLLTTTSDLSSIAGADVVIEAVPERVELKLRVLADAAAAVRADAIIASNTSSIPITRLASAVTAPERFVGVHFFNPVPRMRLVEVIRTLYSSPDVVETVLSTLREDLGKVPIAVDDRPGFVVNALLVPYLISAIRMLDAGYASVEDIDAGMRLGAGHPMGPISLSDLIGLDTLCDVADAIHAETRDPALVVPNALRRLVEAGRLGRKSGRGFYSYG